MWHNCSVRTLILTGANGGIGLATINEMLLEDVKLVCVDKKLDKVQLLSKEFSSRIVLVQSDISSEKECSKIIEAADGRVSGLIHLAGLLESDLDINKDPLLWERVIQNNLKNAYDLVGLILSNLQEDYYSSFVFASSVSYRRGSYESMAYSIAKAGLVGLTRSLAKRIGEKGSVNAIAPGIIETEMSKDYLNRHKERLIKQIPQKRFGQPKEVASLIRFLTSSNSSYITGQVINIDGGSCNS
jgi:NAD(P)-dependent dehydrogenase (short-subunit alcohol dehydrogenase family)